ncbi:DUF2730 family protein [Roseibium aggregatum]|uniref:DUF2730 family protein n=1 Tax=Roseibium aggregatum TaxID=187304 RepID=UPI001E54E436|nr:DUF2730 family protein [Roseibium aggregatum]UES58520.1 DUF2730 family protein [Roseibium aggregatum]
MLDDLQKWLGAVGALLGISSMIYTWITARSRINGETIEKHERKLIDHDRRIQKVENEVDHLPTKDDFNELALKLEQSNGLLGKIEVEYKGLHEAVRRIEKFLISGKGQP